MAFVIMITKVTEVVFDRFHELSPLFGSMDPCFEFNQRPVGSVAHHLDSSFLELESKIFIEKYFSCLVLKFLEWL